MYGGEMNYSRALRSALLSSSLIQIITLRYNLLKLDVVDIPSASPSSSAIPHNKHVIKTHFTGSRLWKSLLASGFFFARRLAINKKHLFEVGSYVQFARCILVDDLESSETH